jgi:Transposase DDE domain
VPAQRAVNNQGDGKLFDRREFHYDEKTDTFRCPANQTLAGKQLQRHKTRVIYAGDPEVCGGCAMKSRCTNPPPRFLHRHLHDEVLQRMQQRATPEMMQLRRSTVEHPFASLKYRIFGHPRFLLRGLQGAQAEISLATMVYNLKRMLNVLGANQLRAALGG